MSGVRDGYAELGVDNYYKQHQNDYRNPHEVVIKKLLMIALKKKVVGKKVLDLCCGSGEVTMVLKNQEVVGTDPYTAVAYKKRTGKDAINLSFKDIVEGKLTDSFDSIICSFALHLCPQSLLPTLLWRLGEISETLIVLTPHKKPDCDNISGWFIVDETLLDRVRMRIYMR